MGCPAGSGDLPLVGIYSTYDASRLVAAIEIVSPGNKDRPEAIVNFVEKVVLLLQDGVHVMVLDVIQLPGRPVRRPLLARLGLDESLAGEQPWVASYCALPGEEPQPHLEVREWAEPAVIGEPLPPLPLFLQVDQLWVWLDLEQSYDETLAAGRYRPV